MRRWIRWLSWTLGWTVLVGTTTLWWLSYRRSDRWFMARDGVDRYWRTEVEASAGGMAVFYDGGRLGDSEWGAARHKPSWYLSHDSHSSPNLAFPLVEGRGPLTWLGLSWDYGRGGTGSLWRLSFPLWMPVIVVAIYLLTGLRRHVRQSRRYRRRAAGLCAECGYDLRGSGARCPECGAEREAPVTAAPDRVVRSP